MGNLDPLSPLITMFFLLCYTAVNASVLIQEWLRPPNWRPRFRFYHPITAFTGLALCLFIMFFTRWSAALPEPEPDPKPYAPRPDPRP